MVSAFGFSDMLSLAQTVGIVGTMVLTLYFSKKQVRSLSIDTQTRGLNDLGEKFLKIVERAAEDKSIQGVLDNEVKYSREEAYSFYILWICSHAYSMRKRNVLDDNEWVVVVTMDETYFSKRNHQTMVETTRARQMV